jgi:hypothetical protein
MMDVRQGGGSAFCKDWRQYMENIGMHYTKLDDGFEQGQIIHNFNNHDYRVMECLSERNLLVMDVNSGSFTIAIGAALYARHPSGSEPTKENSMVGVEWNHGVYLSSTPSAIDFRKIRQEYGTPEKIETVHDYRSHLRKQFYMFETLSQDELATDTINCIWDEGEEMFMPDYSVTVVYEGNIETGDSRSGASAVNESGESMQASFPADSLYYEKDGFAITLANWLNGRLPMEQIEQLWCELIMPKI